MGLFDKLNKLFKCENYEKNKDFKTDNTEPSAVHSQLEFLSIKKLPFSDKEKNDRVLCLTDREREVYLLLLEGFKLKEIAKRLGIKYSTANTHMTGVYKKLGVKTRAELIINYRNI